ncbi:hypothetical protein MPTK1_1g14020 [Marchantia polymorpha subsp. ruderalis]|uniref:Uncharacterized protein n=2 Tax=Marchantia polymorpha TaxID=3197 RepID=A0AAF6APX8_MARPO|nr:hypothetical protein MARPO_0019s0172 [Marchantia polymorpha]BBM98498.1 hypothetical protein Mp_1g14020 [Marchantia polymorpha subsp. ruderalis]|eukprot:PTQ44769.1 hypothetical protein MARPO_0019s0172 [Marchantia polymorpha]
MPAARVLSVICVNRSIAVRLSGRLSLDGNSFIINPVRRGLLWSVVLDWSIPHSMDGHRTDGTDTPPTSDESDLSQSVLRSLDSCGLRWSIAGLPPAGISLVCIAWGSFFAFRWERSSSARKPCWWAEAGPFLTTVPEQDGLTCQRTLEPSFALRVRDSGSFPEWGR